MLQVLVELTMYFACQISQIQISVLFSMKLAQYKSSIEIIISQADLVKHHPVRINLGITLRVQYDSLIGSEVCKRDLRTLWTHVNQIQYCIIVKVILTHVSNTITWGDGVKETKNLDWVKCGWTCMLIF